MNCIQYWLVVDELHFHFRKGRGCRDAIFTLQAVVQRAIKSTNLQASTATLCALDMSKAFDKMSHYGLYINLMELSIPRCFTDILICGYEKCFGVVRYDNYLSCLLYTSPSPRDRQKSRMPSSA